MTSNGLDDKESLIVCNEENGCMSQLFGRGCWVTESILGLIESHVETLHEKDLGDKADEVCQSILDYCKDLKEKNRNYFDDFISEPEPTDA